MLYHNTMRKILLIIAFIVTIAVNLTFEIPLVTLFADKTLNLMATKSICNFTITAFVVALMLCYYKREIQFNIKNIGKTLLWLIPCFLVAIVNFPFSSLLSGKATVDRKNLIWLFVLYSFSIGFAEELLFRGIVHNFVKDFFKEKKNGCFYSAVISSAVFSLWHITNLFFGAGFGATLLQVGYTFLLGGMFAVVYDYTENIWYCVVLHSVFDIGGNLILLIGSGNAQDVVFWILTAVIGVATAVHIIFTLLKLNKRHNEKLSDCN